MPRQRYYFTIADFSAARGTDAALAFAGHSPDALAAQLQQELRSAELFARWRAKQEAPDEVDPRLGVTDPQAVATAAQADLKVDLEVTTEVPMKVLGQRLDWLIGAHWRLHDVR